ncbi:hypothetical protein [Patulibacter americanus]|uniref:hypothetical protein n=1 Tax=Patulibacter americanus TaxID=588672 RepID=UPI0003B3113C|nr:hypothetical protein [Patulibacter americanus]
MAEQARIARAVVAREARDATVAARSRCVRGHAAVMARTAGAAEHGAALLQGLLADVEGRAATAAGNGAPPEFVPIGEVRVRRFTEATDPVRAPVLVPVGVRGGLQLVVGDDRGRRREVLAVAEALIAASAAATDVIVHDPCRRGLRPGATAAPGVVVVHDRTALMRAVGRARTAARPARLVLLDFPGGLRARDRAALRDVCSGDRSGVRPLLVEVPTGAPGVDLVHRRVRPGTAAAGAPVCVIQLWDARGGWRWPAHPGLVVRLPDVSRWPSASGPGHSGRPAAEAAAAVGRLLEALAAVARRHDEEIARVRAHERTLLDGAANRRRVAVAEIERHERAARFVAARTGLSAEFGALLAPRDGDVDPRLEQDACLANLRVAGAELVRRLR